jgi:DNA-binding SARP family transcriptional activator
MADLDDALLSQDLLPDWYEDWLLEERERYRQLRLHALEVLCGRLTNLRQFHQSIQAGLAAVAGEPLRESAQRVLITAYLAEGNSCEALKQYQRYWTLLQTELGQEPSPDLTYLLTRQSTNR